MCKRYTLHEAKSALAAVAEALRMKLPPPEWALNPRYNISPTTVIPVVARGAAGAEPEVRGMVWGLVPFYAREKPGASMQANATAERARTAPAFRQATAKRRCLVPANGYYEWRAVGKTKYPHLFGLKADEPFALAGIWEAAADGIPESVAILTTAPNPVAARIHHRMPVVLPKEAMARWIGSDPLPDAEFESLTAPLDAARMEEREVSRSANNSRNTGPECIAPPDQPEGEFQLQFT